MSSLRFRPLSLLTLSLLCTLAAPSFAQDEKDEVKVDAPVKVAEVQPPPPLVVAPPAFINFKERPKYAVESARLKRSPILDGVVTEGEYDLFYQITEGAVKGSIYLNWDDDYLYVASSSAAGALIIDIDGNNDGWLHGLDNLEIVVGNVNDKGEITKEVRLLDGTNSKDGPVWSAVVDSKKILVLGKTVGEVQFLEVAIPRGIAGLLLKPGRTIGVRAELMPPLPAGAYAPTASYEPHLLFEAKLGDAKTESVPGLAPKLNLSDITCIAGQNLFATLEIQNQTDHTIGFRSITWSGQRNAAGILNTVREVTVPEVISQKILKLKYKTQLPVDAALGTYALDVLVELMDGRKLEAVGTFTVAEPLDVSSSVSVTKSKDGVLKATIAVELFSRVPKGVKVELEAVSFPEGWVIEGKKNRGIEIDREDARKVAKMNFKLPSNIARGEYPVELSLSWHKRVWHLKQVVKIAR